MPVSPQELQAQAQQIAEKLKITVPPGVGFAIVFYNQGRDTAVGFGCNATTENEKREAVQILREFAKHLTPSRIIVPN